MTGRGTTCACLGRESLREPDAANPHVRFDEGRGSRPALRDHLLSYSTAAREHYGAALMRASHSNFSYLYQGSKLRPSNGSRFRLCFARITPAWNPESEQGKCEVRFAFQSVGGPRGGTGIGREFNSIASCLFRPIKSGVRRSQQCFEVRRNRWVGDCHPQAD